MEALLAGAQQDGANEFLIGNLRYGLDPQGSYISARRASTSFATTNICSPKTVKQLQVNLASASEWLDPSSVLLSFLIRETGGVHSLFPASPNPAILFNRFQLRLGSTLIEDVQDWGKLNHIMSMYSMSPGKLRDYHQTGFGTEETATNPNAFLSSQHKAKKIPASGTKRVYMKFDLSALFSQHRWLPLFALGGMGCQISLTLAPGAESLIVADSPTAAAADYSTEYQIEDIRVLADFISLQDDLQESYNASLLQGSALRLPVKLWSCQTMFLTSDHAGSFDLALSKNYTRLASLFAFFNQNPPDTNYGSDKLVNTNYFPGGPAIEELRYALHLGSKRVPDEDVRGSKEAWYRLLGCLGMRDSLAHCTSIDEAAYNSTHFGLGIDLERIPSLMASGENVSAGQTIQLRIRGMKGANGATDVPRTATVCTHSEAVISIQDTVVDIFE